MMNREMIAVSSQNLTKHKYTLCGQNVELFNVILVLNIVITGIQTFKYKSYKQVIKCCIGK
jgi:hypothetical protein